MKIQGGWGIKKMTNNTTSKTTRTKIHPMILKKTPAYISHLIRHYIGFETYHDFHYKGLLLPRMLLNQGFLVIKLVSLVEQELITFPGYVSSLSGFSGVCVAHFLVFCVVFCNVSLPFLLAIVLSVFRFMTSDNLQYLQAFL